jgi:hypothetical protein
MSGGQRLAISTATQAISEGWVSLGVEKEALDIGMTSVLGSTRHANLQREAAHHVH